MIDPLIPRLALEKGNGKTTFIVTPQLAIFKGHSHEIVAKSQQEAANLCYKRHYSHINDMHIQYLQFDVKLKP